MGDPLYHYMLGFFSFHTFNGKRETEIENAHKIFGVCQDLALRP